MTTDADQHAPSTDRGLCHCGHLDEMHGPHCRDWVEAGIDCPCPAFQHAPSAGQPVVDLEAIRRRHPRAFDERWALIPGSPNSDIHQLTAEVESLKQQIAAGRQTQASLLSNMESYALEVRGLQIQLIAAQAERDEFKQGLEVAEFEQGFANVWRENERLRAQVDWLKQEHADMHPACSAEPGHCPHEAQVEAMRGVVEAVRKHYPTIAGRVMQLIDAGEGHAADEWNAVAHAFYDSLAALDAASDGQPKSDA